MKNSTLAFLPLLFLLACSTPALPVEEGEPEISASVVVWQDIAFTLPEGWTAEEQMQGYDISVPDENYEVTLVWTVSQESEGALPLEGSEVETTADGIQLYNIGCGGAYYCGNFAYAGQAYGYSFQVRSTQPVPENLDGIWIPDTEVTQEDLEDFIASAHLAD